MMTTDALKKLHTAMLDTREGYEVAEKNAETPALTELFGQMITLRSKDHQAIHSTLIDMGEHPDDSGSLMAVVHKSVTSVRAAVAGISSDALSPFISGEEQIAKAYDAAIDEASANAAVRDMLIDQQTALLAKIAEMMAIYDGRKLSPQ